MRGYPSITKFVLVAGAVLLSIASASARSAETSTRVAEQTVYLHQAIDGFHRIAIFGNLGGSELLVLDPNTCSVNEFGDTQICTRIALVERRIRLIDTGRPDPANLGRTQYLLEGSGLPNPLFLVVWPDPSRPKRLVHNNRGPDAPRPVTLEPLVWSRDGAVKTASVTECRGRYRAFQTAGEVFVIASGSHPTGGYTTYLEELPITVFPPEFRLICIPPAGPATQVVTPFLAIARFPAGEPVEKVVAHDSAGAHEVTVDQDEAKE